MQRAPLKYVGPGPSAPHFENVHFEKKDRGRRPLRRTFLSEWMVFVGNSVKKFPGNFLTELCQCPEHLQKHSFGHKVWSRSRRRHQSEESFPGNVSSDWLSEGKHSDRKFPGTFLTELKKQFKISDETRQGRCADETEISSGGSSAWRSGGRHFVRTQCKGLSRLEPLPESLLLLALYLDVD